MGWSSRNTVVGVVHTVFEGHNRQRGVFPCGTLRGPACTAVHHHRPVTHATAGIEE